MIQCKSVCGHVYMQRGDSIFVLGNAVIISSSCVKIGLAAYGRLDLCCWPGRLHIKWQSAACSEITSFKVEGRSDKDCYLTARLKLIFERLFFFFWCLGRKERTRDKKRERRQKRAVSHYACRKEGGRKHS